MLRGGLVFIQCEEDGQVFFSLDDGVTKFTDLIQLVEFYQLNRGVLPCKLKHPCTVVALWHLRTMWPSETWPETNRQGREDLRFSLSFFIPFQEAGENDWYFPVVVFYCESAGCCWLAGLFFVFVFFLSLFSWTSCGNWCTTYSLGSTFKKKKKNKDKRNEHCHFVSSLLQNAPWYRQYSSISLVASRSSVRAQENTWFSLKLDNQQDSGSYSMDHSVSYRLTANYTDGDFSAGFKLTKVHVAFKGAWHLFWCITQLDMAPPYSVFFGMN